jgi:hypothetical protein
MVKYLGQVLAGLIFDLVPAVAACGHLFFELGYQLWAPEFDRSSIADPVDGEL